MRIKGSALFLALALFSFVSLAQVDRITGRHFATRSEVIATNGMVATSQPLATQIGLDILKKGGNAIDAAIAANAALGLMEPTGNGIGGDLFAIVWSAKEQKLYGLNASGRSPKGLSYKQLMAELKKLDRDSIPAYGHLPISVPGTIDGWGELHKKFGSLPLKTILQPTIDYARAGFPVSELISYYWKRSAPRLSKQPGAFKQTFTFEGRGPEKGELFKNPDLAYTLQTVAEEGTDVFYKGHLADKMDKFFKATGGYLRKVDFETHTSTWVTPVAVNYRGIDVYELPPNGQGIAALQIFQMLKQFDVAAMGHNSPEYLHTLVELKKLVFEDRAKFYADPDFFQVPLKGLLSEAYAKERLKLFNPHRAARTVDAGNPALYQGDTIYMCAADKDGNMISLIQSNYRGMGSGVVTPGLGFVFQDRGELFHLTPGHANVYEPGKRPFHTIIPAFAMKDGKPFMAFGVMGGAMQPQGHVQIIVNMADFGMNLQEAGDAARWQHFGSSEPTGGVMKSGGYVELEKGIPWETIRALKLKGHDVRSGMGGFGGYQAIMRDPKTGVYYGASESRKDGQAAGY